MKEDWFNFSFVKGPVSSEQIAKRIASHQTEIHSGAYNIFLGQVRADKIEGKKVEGIDYTTKEEMASVVFKQISEDAKKNFELFSVDILHSTGPVMAGEICLMVLVTCGHRKRKFRRLPIHSRAPQKRSSYLGKRIDGRPNTFMENQ